MSTDATPPAAVKPHYDFSQLVETLRTAIAKLPHPSRDEILKCGSAFLGEAIRLAETVGGAGPDKKAAVLLIWDDVVKTVIDPALLHGPAAFATPVVNTLLHDGASALIDWFVAVIFQRSPFHDALPAAPAAAPAPPAVHPA